MALHHAEQELIYITSVIDAVIELHPSTFRQLMNEDEANISKYVARRTALNLPILSGRAKYFGISLYCLLARSLARLPAGSSLS
jgi:hypothetical protein